MTEKEYPKWIISKGKRYNLKKEYKNFGLYVDNSGIKECFKKIEAETLRGGF
jgi:hypothetical protein